MRFIFCFLTLLAMAGMVPAPAAADKVNVFASIVPQEYFLKKIGGDLVSVSVMVKPGASPATYEPTPKQMAALAQAKAYFAMGVPFELAWLPRIAAAKPSMRIIRVDKGIEKREMEAHHHHHEDESEGHGHGHDHDHGHGHDHDHDHGHGHDHDHHHHDGLDPHVWLAPATVRMVAQNTHDGLVKIDAANAATYGANLQAFLAEIDALDKEIQSIIAAIPEEKRRFMVFHPSWGYFADQYGLKQVPIEVQGKEPGPKQLARIIEEGREEGVSVVFVQPQFSTKSAEVIAKELGAKVLHLDPLAENWSVNLLKAAKTFQLELK